MGDLSCYRGRYLRDQLVAAAYIPEIEIGLRDCIRRTARQLTRRITRRLPKTQKTEGSVYMSWIQGSELSQEKRSYVHSRTNIMEKPPGAIGNHTIRGVSALHDCAPRRVIHKKDTRGSFLCKWKQWTAALFVEETTVQISATTEKKL